MKFLGDTQMISRCLQNISHGISISFISVSGTQYKQNSHLETRSLKASLAIWFSIDFSTLDYQFFHVSPLPQWLLQKEVPFPNLIRTSIDKGQISLSTLHISAKVLTEFPWQFLECRGSRSNLYSKTLIRFEWGQSPWKVPVYCQVTLHHSKGTN